MPRRKDLKSLRFTFSSGKYFMSQWKISLHIFEGVYEYDNTRESRIENTESKTERFRSL